MMQDVRWMQRFDSYRKALETLDRAVVLAGERPLSELEKQGVVQGFEFTHDLSWNLLKDYLSEQGIVGIIGSRNAVRESFRNALVADGEVWMEMIATRNLTSHTYNPAIVERIVVDIIDRYYPAFRELRATFDGIMAKESAP
ncbi:nucleotidyltransferase substrate binding protein [Myxococcota bacterium]|nr:nucleotidyltransferase substrate binding protein [Myxococcota bacterium]